MYKAVDPENRCVIQKLLESYKETDGYWLKTYISEKRAKDKLR